MITTVENLTIDVYGTQKRTVVFAKQADGGTRRLCVRITEHSTTLAASPEDTAVFGVCRPDGEAKAYFATVNDDGTVTVDIPAWATEVAGVALCDIAIIGTDAFGNKLRLGTAVFYLNVEQAACADDAIAADDKADVLSAMIAEVRELRDTCADAAAAVTGANEAAEAANAAADAANAAATGAVFKGATETEDGLPGIVPKPTTADYGKVLGADGKWQDATPKDHTQAAGTITAGIFAGKVVANAEAEATLDEAMIRNIRITTETITEGVTEIAPGEIVIKI